MHWGCFWLFCVLYNTFWRACLLSSASDFNCAKSRAKDRRKKDHLRENTKKNQPNIHSHNFSQYLEEKQRLMPGALRQDIHSSLFIFCILGQWTEAQSWPAWPVLAQGPDKLLTWSIAADTSTHMHWPNTSH